MSVVPELLIDVVESLEMDLYIHLGVHPFGTLYLTYGDLSNIIKHLYSNNRGAMSPAFHGYGSVGYQSVSINGINLAPISHDELEYANVNAPWMSKNGHYAIPMHIVIYALSLSRIGLLNLEGWLKRAHGQTGKLALSYTSLVD
jgi:hypothetical protein